MNVVNLFVYFKIAMSRSIWSKMNNVRVLCFLRLKNFKKTKLTQFFSFGHFDQDMAILKKDILVIELWLPDF